MYCATFMNVLCIGQELLARSTPLFRDGDMGLSTQHQQMLHRIGQCEVAYNQSPDHEDTCTGDDHITSELGVTKKKEICKICDVENSVKTARARIVFD
jgi:hypothetical protein